MMIHEFALDLSIGWCLRHRADLGQGVHHHTLRRRQEGLDAEPSVIS
jgi:hypothetical protein